MVASSQSRLEILETRIAPAVLFLSGSADTVVDSRGDSVNDDAAAMGAGATVAVALNAGDSLVLDVNGNHVVDAGEITFAKVTGGRAIVFATSHDATAGFSPDEITGLAVGNGVKARINGIVYGPIVTALDSAGAFTPGVIQPAAISSLTVSDRVTGSIFAGKSISNLDIGRDATSGEVSVDEIATGTRTSGHTMSFNGGGLGISFNFSFSKPGEAGGSITNAFLSHGAEQIGAGDGANHPTGNGGAGGSVSGVEYGNSAGTILIYAGNGGDSGVANGKGGKGGSISALEINHNGSFTNTGYIEAGDGGDGDFGGAGGVLKGLTLNFSQDVAEYLLCNAGTGGNGVSGLKKGPGGAGGTASGIKIKSTAKVEFIGIYGGDGGDAASGSSGNGGNGGKVSSVTYEALGGNYGPYYAGGDGGAGRGKGNGGNGGDVVNTKASVGDTDSNSDIYGGNGGDGGEGGVGGRGGNVVNFNHACADIPGNDTTGYLWVYGGEGGDGGTAGGKGGNATNGKMTGGDGATGFYIYGGYGGDGTFGTKGKGGNGGNISNVLVDIGASNDESQFFSGDGGDGRDANAGHGGSISNFTVIQKRNISNLFEISTGDGGRVVSGNGNGGNGGALLNSSFTKTDGPGIPNSAEIEIFTGDGGDGAGTGNGGAGGAMTKMKIDFQSAINDLYFYTGDGGDAGTSGKKGGASGSMSSISLAAAAAFGNDPSIGVGDGGDASGAGAKGGDTGSIDGFTLAAPNSSLVINRKSVAGTGGSGPSARGGNGGNVSGVKGTVGILSVFAPDGGSSGGTGGNGGSIDGLKITAATDFVRLIKAGDGGNGDSAGGAGGSVSKTSVAGDIGDFTSNFAISSDIDSMGGLIAGQGGMGNGVIAWEKNGSILGAKAERIAAIIAGASAANELENTNAVKKITGLKSLTALGADVDGDTNFDFIDIGAPGFSFNDDDTALDGLVIVFEHLTPPSGVTVLKLITP